MPKLFKPKVKTRLPDGAEVVTEGGAAFARLPDRRNRPALYPLTPDGGHYLRPAAKWHAWVGKPRRRVPLSTDKGASELMLADLLKRSDAEQSGLRDPAAAHAKTPLGGHLKAWAATLAAGQNGPKYVALKLARAKAAVAWCGWASAPEMSAARLEAFLSALRTPPPPPARTPDKAGGYTLAEAAGLTGGGTAGAARKLANRHGVPIRNGRVDAAGVDVLALARSAAPGPATSNHYLQAVRQFAGWMVDNGRLARDPFASLKPLNARLDRRRTRGDLSQAERSALLAAALASPRDYRGLTGTDRAMLYRVALGTGFRATELASLTPGAFDLAAGVVRLAAGSSKNRKPVEQPIPPHLLIHLCDYLAAKPARRAVWPGTWHTRAAEMVALDLAAGGVAVAVEGRDGDEVRDFHALRAAFVSDVVRSGATLTEAMTLARHSDPKLTTATYARVGRPELAAVAAKLPAHAPSASICASARGETGGESGPGGDVLPGASGRDRNPGTATESLAGKAFEDDRGGPGAVGEVVDRSAPGASRTRDLRFRKPPLYPLSYGGVARSL